MLGISFFMKNEKENTNVKQKNQKKADELLFIFLVKINTNNANINITSNINEKASILKNILETDTIGNDKTTKTIKL